MEGATTVPQVVANTLDDLRAEVGRWRSAGLRVALVPTMGALHEGHLALVRRARREADRTVVSIFVNPAQFAPSEDFATYPRTFEADCAMLAGHGTNLVYAPTAATMYPDGFSTAIVPRGPALAGLEDAFRPHFFAGVATVVTKLLTQCGPDVALFGEKDFQQVRVVERVARDLDLPVAVLGVETVREADGLAMSSRNRNLSERERAAAATLPRVGRDLVMALRRHEPPDAALLRGRTTLEQAGFAVDYLALRDARTLGPPIDGDATRLLAAARLGTTRLIDNWPV